MYQVSILGLDDAQAALDTMLTEAAKEPDRPVAIAIVDSEGDLICYARMDRAGPVPRRAATRKAYTAARARSDSAQYAERLSALNLSAGDMDPNFVGVLGGLCLIHNGAVVGGIGVSGRTAEEDQELARIGQASLGI